MTINDTVIHDVLVGEVWLGSGQSNMEFRLQTAMNHDEEIAKADYPMIHLFQVKRAVADQPAEDVVGHVAGLLAGIGEDASPRWSISSGATCSRICTCRWA